MLTRRAGFTWLAPRVLAPAALLLVGLAGCTPSAPRANLVVSARTQRTVVPLTRLAWLSSEQQSGFLPAAVVLGGRGAGRTLLYLEFPEQIPRTGRLLVAYLVLDGAAQAVSPEPVEIALMRAQRASVVPKAWGERPAAVLPRVTARLAPRTPPFRIDATELLQADQREHRPSSWLLLAEPADREGVVVATGAAGGAAPRLEIYWE